jgi:hypothetical protein
MKTAAAFLAIVALVAVSALAARQAPPAASQPERVRNDSKLIQFRAIDIFIDSKSRPLAAYQLEFKPIKGDVKIVGIEGGEHEKFSSPPYYDPQAMQQERVIIAAFSTAPLSSLPTGRTRIATIHVQIVGDSEPEFVVAPSVLATSQGKAIEADVEVKARENSPLNRDTES